jgi:pyruvate dehydrogenase E2 component (dihydrolipoamide acetyltransferase)
VEEDVVKAQTPPTQVLPAGTDQPLSQMRKAIARATTQSKAPVPHFYLTSEIDMEQAERFRDQFKQNRITHPSVTDLLIKAAALALTRHPEINVSFTGQAIRRHAHIDIGIAVGIDDGLITPVIRNCGAKSLDNISTESRTLFERARNKRLQPQEYADATFSISNLGMFDVENFIAVLIPPQAASIAVGSIRDAAIVKDGTVKVGRRMKVTLSCDHRALDGLQGAGFLKELKRILEHPSELLSSKETP